MIHPTAKVFERTNRNLPARNKLVQLLGLALYTDPESHNAQRYRLAYGRRDGQHDDAISRLYCVAVRLFKNRQKDEQRLKRCIF